MAIEFGSDEAARIRERDREQEQRVAAREQYPQDYKRVLRMRWYTLGSPWSDEGPEEGRVQAGSDDPHIASFVADASNWFLSDDERGVYECPAEIAEHIARLHNEWLARQREGGDGDAK